MSTVSVPEAALRKLLDATVDHSPHTSTLFHRDAQHLDLSEGRTEPFTRYHSCRACNHGWSDIYARVWREDDDLCPTDEVLLAEGIEIHNHACPVLTVKHALGLPVKVWVISRAFDRKVWRVPLARDLDPNALPWAEEDEDVPSAEDEDAP